MSYLMSLGPFTFSLQSFNFQKFDRNFAFRWEPQMRIGRRPALQYLGPGEETVEMQGVIYPHYFGGLSQYEQMRSAAKSGTPYPLVSGTGKNYGLFCIRALKDGNAYMISTGVPRKVEFTISLAAYGADGLGIDGSGGFFAALGGALSLTGLSSIIPIAAAALSGGSQIMNTAASLYSALGNIGTGMGSSLAGMNGFVNSISSANIATMTPSIQGSAASIASLASTALSITNNVQLGNYAGITSNIAAAVPALSAAAGSILGDSHLSSATISGLSPANTSAVVAQMASIISNMQTQVSAFKMASGSLASGNTAVATNLIGGLDAFMTKTAPRQEVFLR